MTAEFLPDEVFSRDADAETTRRAIATQLHKVCTPVCEQPDFMHRSFSPLRYVRCTVSVLSGFQNPKLFRQFKITNMTVQCELDVKESFTMLHEKQMPSSEVVLACWCPTMDLLSILTDDNQLTVYRLDFQRVWIACPDLLITAIAWSPDGNKTLVIK